MCSPFSELPPDISTKYQTDVAYYVEEVEDEWKPREGQHVQHGLLREGPRTEGHCLLLLRQSKLGEIKREEIFSGKKF